MADSTLTAPVMFADLTAAGLNALEVDAAVALGKRFADITSPLAFMMGVPIGGSGTRTARMPNADHIGSVLPTALASEVSQPALINRTVGYSEVSVADFGFSHASTWTMEIYGKANAVRELSIEQALAEAPASAYRLARYLMGGLFTSITDTVGSVSTRLSVDDTIAAQALFNSNVPVGAVGAPMLSLHPRQLAQLRESLRVEPSFQQSGLAMAIQQVDMGRVLPNFAGLGFDALVMDEVQASGGGRYGAALDRGACALAIGQVQNLMPPPGLPLYVASGALGLIAFQDMTAWVQRMKRLDVHLQMGAALADDAVRRQVAVISIDAA